MEGPSSTPPPGWFQDPFGRYEHRWFNGSAWTADVSSGGVRYVDPLGAMATHAAPPMRRSNSAATAGLTCSLIGLLLAWMPWIVILGFALGVVGVSLAWVGLRRSREGAGGRGRATAGLVLGGATLALSVLGVMFTISFTRELDAFLDPAPHRAEVTECRVEASAVVVVGELTNRSSRPHDFTVFAVVREAAGVDGEVPDLVGQLEAVEPGSTRPFELRRSVPAASAGGTCRARLVVHGPFPYGLELERIDG